MVCSIVATLGAEGVLLAPTYLLPSLNVRSGPHLQLHQLHQLHSVIVPSSLLGSGALHGRPAVINLIKLPRRPARVMSGPMSIGSPSLECQGLSPKVGERLGFKR